MNTKTKTAAKAETKKADQPTTDEQLAAQAEKLAEQRAEMAKAEQAQIDRQAAVAQAEASAGSDDESEIEGTTVSTVQVEITKDPMMKPVLRVYEHEIALLEEIHGPDNVHVREETIRDGEIRATADQEYSRLETRYGRAGQAALQKVYGSPDELARASGLSMTAQRRRRLGSRNASAETAQSSQRGAGVD